MSLSAQSDGFQDLWLTAHDGKALYARWWKPPSQAEGVVAFVHGLGEHTGRYSGWARRFADCNYHFLAHDQRGHGRTDKRRGHVCHYDLLLDDVEVLVHRAHEIAAGRPVFVYGHSLGGTIVLNYVLRRDPQIQGAIVTSPLLELTTPAPLLLRVSLHLCNYVFPWLTVHNRIRPSDLSHDEQACDAYSRDPLVSQKISARLAHEAFAAATWAMKRAGSFEAPLLLMHGEDDAVTSPEATRKFADACNASGKGSCTFTLWTGMYHELHFEPDSGCIFLHMLSWLRETTTAC